MNFYQKIALGMCVLASAAATAYYAGYKNATRYHTQLETEAQNLALLKERELKDEYIAALNDARLRQETLFNDFDALSSEYQRLRDNVQNSLPTNTESPGINTATTYAKLFTDCAKEYGAMAKNADQHAHDLKTIRDAWPN